MTRILERTRPRTELRPREDVVRYYEVAGPDYAAWSPKFNMHFGYWDGRTNPFRREAMLDRMNEVALDRLRLDEHRPVAIADMGCGLGATARFVAARRPNARVSGFTIVPWQVASGNRISEGEGLRPRVRLALADYARTPLRDASVDAAYAIESTSYAAGADKDDLVAELARIVKPGGRVHFSDGFLKMRRLGPLSRWIYETVCRSWAIDEMAAIGPFVRALERHGFADVRVEEVSWKVAPSFAHVPFLCLSFALRRFLHGEFRWSKERRQNLVGSFFGCLLGLCRSRIGYYLVGATRNRE